MALILSIETSTSICSIALHQKGNLIASQEIEGEKTHSTELTLMIDKLLKDNNYAYSQLEAIAVSNGPGSYTGLRIGTSTAKGLCFALDKPLIAVSTLEAIAHHTPIYEKPYLICPLLDARRMEVYCMLLTDEFDALENVQAKIIDENSFKKELETQKIVFVGNATEKCAEVIHHENAIFEKDILPTAKTIGFLAYQKYKNQVFEDIAYFEPYYLKEFMALKGKKLV